MKKIILTLFILTIHTTLSYSSDQYVLTADNASMIDSNTYNAKGNVILKTDDLTVTAEEITYFLDNKSIIAKGNVKLESPTQTIEATDITYDLANNIGVANNITGFIAPYHYICADKLMQTSPTSFTLEGARISTCSGDLPDWSFSIYSGELQTEGYMSANHLSLDILNTPIVYLPKLTYSMNAQRKSGFLIPNIGISSINGFFLSAAYFIAPDINYDITVALNIFSNNGLQPLVEARYAHSEKSNFYASMEWIHDISSETGDNNRWRYILANQFTPINNLTISLNANEASDYLYSEDFNDYSITPYYKENKENFYFIEADINYFTDYAEINISYKNIHQFRNNELGYNKNLAEYLPSISVQKTIPILPFLVVDYKTSFDRVITTDTLIGLQNITTSKTSNYYNRFHFESEIMTPIDVGIAIITPSIKAGYTLWAGAKNDFNISNNNNIFNAVELLDNNTVQRYYSSILLTTSFREIYRKYKYFTHTIVNTFTLNYTPQFDQTGLPRDFLTDYINPAGGMTYKLVNYLKSENWDTTLTLTQGLDFLEQTSLTPLLINMSVYIHGILNNTFELVFNYPTTTSSTSASSTNIAEIEYISNKLRLDIYKYLFLELDYAHDKRINTDFNTSIRVGGGTKIWRFELSGFNQWQGYNTDGFSNLHAISHGASLSYVAECWAIGVKVVRDIYNTNFISGQKLTNDITTYITFSLRGLFDQDLQFNTTTFTDVN